VRSFFFLFLMVSVTAVSFAQFTWNFSAEFNVRTVSIALPIGENAQKIINVNGQMVPNIGTNNPGNWTNGDYTYNAGSRNFFTFYNIFTRDNTSNLSVGYRIWGFEANISLDLNNLVRSTEAAGTGKDKNEVGHSLVQGDGRTVNWGDFFTEIFGWSISGDIGFISAKAGNLYDRGKVSGFNAVSWELLSNVLIDHYGINTPNSNGDFNEHGLDPNSIGRTVRQNKTSQGYFYFYELQPSLIVSAALSQFNIPLTVQIAADLGDNLNSTFSSDVNFKKFSGAVRVSGEKIGNFLTFDTIYKFRGGDTNILESYDLDGNEYSSHVFGVYGNILGLKNFGIGFGYSGLLKVFEDSVSRATGDVTHYSGPFFSGIDFRINYTGIADTSLTYHFNVSFAKTAKSSEDTNIVGMWGNPLYHNRDGYGEDYQQNWLGFYNAASFYRKINSYLYTVASIACRYGFWTTTHSRPGYDDYTERKTFLRFGAGGYIGFQTSRSLVFQGGLNILLMNQSYNNAGPDIYRDTRNASGGSLEFSIPIRMRYSIGS